MAPGHRAWQERRFRRTDEARTSRGSQLLESRTHGKPSVKGRKASSFGAGSQFRAGGYGHVMTRIRERIREREERLEMAVSCDRCDEHAHAYLLVS